MSLIKEFKEFAMRGNVVDLAVGVIMGTAFGKIVGALVNDVLMPPIGYLVGGVDFKDLKFKLTEANVPNPKDPTKMLNAVAINYGNFLQTVLDFLIVAFCIFMMVKLMNTLMKKKEEAPPVPAETPADIKLLTEIRDALVKR